MTYVIKFPGKGKRPEKYLVKKNDNYWQSQKKEEAAHFEDNEEAVNAALTLVKTLAMMGMPTLVFNVEWQPKEEGSQEVTQKGKNQVN